MPFCPKCGEEVTSLVHVFQPYYVVLSEEVEIGENGRIRRGSLEIEDIGGEYEVEYFACPLCGAELFDDWDDAKAFLKGDLEAHVKSLGRVDNKE